MTISHYYKCDFCGEKKYISSIDEAQSLKRCPYCQNEYGPFNLIEKISPDSVNTNTNNFSNILSERLSFNNLKKSPFIDKIYSSFPKDERKGMFIIAGTFIIVIFIYLTYDTFCNKSPANAEAANALLKFYFLLSFPQIITGIIMVLIGLGKLKEKYFFIWGVIWFLIIYIYKNI